MGELRVCSRGPPIPLVTDAVYDAVLSQTYAMAVWGGSALSVDAHPGVLPVGSDTYFHSDLYWGCC